MAFLAFRSVANRGHLQGSGSTRWRAAHDLLTLMANI